MDKPQDIEKKPGWFSRHKVLTVVIVLVGIVLVAGAGSGSSTQSQNSGGQSDLNATVSTNTKGVVVTNNESDDWQDCFVGVNGPTGWGFDSPPYRTQGAFYLGGTTIPAGTTITVSYGSLVASDGTRFDIQTHAVTSIVVSCSNSTRAWAGKKE